MNCKKCSERLSLFVLNELPKKEADEISEHLKNCENCSLQERELTALLQKMSVVEEIESPADFLEKLSSRAKKELWINTSKKTNFPRYFKYSSIAALFVICVFSVIYFNAFGGLRSKSSNSSATASQALAGASGNSINKTAKSNDMASSAAANKDNTKAKAAPEAPKNSDSIANSKTDNAERQNTNAFAAYNALNAPKSSETTAAPKLGDNSIVDEHTTANINSKDGASSTDKDVLSTPAPLKHVELLSQQIEVKGKNRDEAFSWITEKASELKGEVIPTFGASLFTTQESTYFAAKSATAGARKATDDTITIEVKSENSEQFTKSIEEYFGVENVKLEIVENVTADKIRYVIKIVS